MRSATIRASGDLREMSGGVVDDFIAGRWHDLFGKPRSDVRRFLLGELLQRCQGFSTREYRVALDTALSLRNHALKVRRLTRKHARMNAK